MAQRMTMQNRLDIHDLDRAIDLGHWCKANLARDDWSIELLNMVPPHYKFEFTDPHMTTKAALST